MVRKIIKTVKNILFVDPELIFAEEKELIKQPFYFKGNNGKGVLLIHGWTSTAYEVRRLGKYLNEEGFTVSGPMLRGHGTQPEDLENVKWQDWLEDLLRAYDDLKKDCDQIYVGGTSVGSIMAAFLAIERPETKGLVLMATPYRIKFEKIIELWGNTMLLFKEYAKKYYPPTFGSRATITRLISYQAYPFKSAFEVYALIKEFRKNLKKITQPCFILQSTHDHIIEKDSLEKIYKGISSEVKEKKYIKRAYHTFISDIKNEHVFEAIADFLKKN